MEAEETTADSYRFEVEVDADSTVSHAIVEERVYSQTIGITNLNYDQIMVWVRNEDLDADGRSQLERIAALKRQLTDNQVEQQLVDQRVNEFSQDQDRLRRNISTLRSVAGQQDKVMEYAERLASLEGRRVALRDKQSDLRRAAVTLQQQLNSLIETLRF